MAQIRTRAGLQSDLVPGGQCRRRSGGAPLLEPKLGRNRLVLVVADNSAGGEVFND